MKKVLPHMHQPHRLFQDLMDSIPDVIYFKDRRGRLVMVNRAHARGLGLTPAQVVGKTDFDIFPKARAEKMFRDDMRVIRTGRPLIDKIERATRPDGIDNYVSTTKIPRRNHKGTIIGLIGITRDITRRMQLERLKEEKEEAEKKLRATEALSKLKSEFISIASHELRTPLAIAKQELAMLLEGTCGQMTKKQKRSLGNATINLERLKNIIDDLLDFSRLERGAFQLRYSLVNLNDLMMASCAFFQRIARQRRIRMECVVPRDQINMFVDAGRLHQVFSNLLDNALRFTKEDGRIKVEARILETKIRIGVIDNGMGIDSTDAHRLFTKYAQLSGVSTATGEGLGLGLSICKEIVEKHGGEIWAESKIGAGSKLYFTLPRLFSVNILDKKKKAKINTLLSSGIPVYLINLLVIHYRKVERKLSRGAGRLFGDLQGIIERAFKGYACAGNKSPQLVAADSANAEFTFMLPEADEAGAHRLCRALKDAINQYLTREKIENAFINLGFLPYARREHVLAKVELSANIKIKRMYLGLEMRQFKRIAYEAYIRILRGGDKPQEFKTVDISEGGICYISTRPLETEARVKIKFKLPGGTGIGMNQLMYCNARVAWIKGIGKIGKKRAEGFTVGLEFVALSNRNRLLLSRFIRLRQKAPAA